MGSTVTSLYNLSSTNNENVDFFKLETSKSEFLTKCRWLPPMVGGYYCWGYDFCRGKIAVVASIYLNDEVTTGKCLTCLYNTLLLKQAKLCRVYDLACKKHHNRIFLMGN